MGTFRLKLRQFGGLYTKSHKSANASPEIYGLELRRHRTARFKYMCATFALDGRDRLMVL